MSKKKVDIQEFLKTDRAILIICMSVAFVFWLFTKLSSEYPTNTTIKLEYVLPANKILINPPPKQLEITIKGEGWDLMFRKKHPKITFELTSDSLQTIDFQELKRDISRTYSAQIEITNITPSQLNLLIDDYLEKDIPLVLDNEVSILPQYQLASPISIIPENVKIKGPASLVKKINTWNTKLLTIPSLDRDIYDQIGVLPHPNLQILFEPSFVDYAVKIEHYTEKVIEIPLQVMNASDTLKIFPKTIKATCIVGLSDYDKVSASDFTAVIDVLSVDFEKARTLSIELIEQPNFVRNIHFTPKSVDFVIFRGNG